MIKFLIQRPIAVLMAFTACFIIGLVTYSTLPISLLPNIAIPEITVQVASANTSARELENTIVKPLRGQLIQVSTLKDIHSESRDGAGIIRLSFEYGTNTDLAFIEVNEKIDAAMNYLPKEAERPKVIKASATDIPVFYLNLTLKNDSAYGATEQHSFLELCEFAESVIKRRIEQLEEVAMVDVTGILERQVQIVPDKDKLAMMGLSIGDIESALSSNNVEPGSMTVRDGYYEYNIKFSTLLRTAEDVENIYLRKGDRIVQLKDFCKVSVVPVKEKGVSLSNGKRAVSLAVIKQADENMDKMKQALVGTMTYFQLVYPEIDFSISRNQTELLDYTISNLQQNLSLGFLFICLVAVLFLGAYNYIREGSSVAAGGVIGLLLDFLRKQGVSFNVLCIAYDSMPKVRSFEAGNYTFGDFTDYFLHNDLVEGLLGLPDLGTGNNVVSATQGHSFSHAMSYAAMGDSYLEGHGYGSSFILETFFDFGWLGVVLGALVFGFLTILLVRWFQKGWVAGTITLVSLTSLFFVPLPAGLSSLSQPNSCWL